MTPLIDSGLTIRENEPLKLYTTFKIGGPARYFATVSDAEHVRKAMAFARENGLARVGAHGHAPLRVFILGGGSNILVSDRGFDGLVLHPAMKGVEAAEEDSDHVSLRVAAAESWDSTVAQAVGRGWWGIENLSHIPGQSGAALVQNVGAYGQQLSDVLESAEVLELATGEVRTLHPDDIEMGYRRSIFNTTRKGDFFILSITLRLSKRPRPNLHYQDVRAYFDERAVSSPSQAEIRQAIISIRDRKFPFPREERGGNAGSFFKNLVLNAEEYAALEEQVLARFGAAQHSRLLELRKLSSSQDAIRIPAAFLISACGLKGHEIGGAKVNPSQPLVILNQGGATADDVLRLAGHIRRTVHRETGVALNLEPELVGFSDQERARYLGIE
ncbi:MAG TPA: UDP-N-acetylmuramate dehydrogenase [Terriglobia bacterium]|nr:UDP-N-acetylmuramate dehydrogenase [Terriglobia bacterium]